MSMTKELFKQKALIGLASGTDRVVSTTGAVFGGALKIIGDTANTIVSTVNLTNEYTRLTTDRVSYGLKVKDNMKRDEYELQIVEHLIDYGEREEELRQRAATLQDSTIESTSDRKNKYAELAAA